MKKAYLLLYSLHLGEVLQHFFMSLQKRKQISRKKKTQKDGRSAITLWMAESKGPEFMAANNMPLQKAGVTKRHNHYLEILQEYGRKISSFNITTVIKFYELIHILEKPAI